MTKLIGALAEHFRATPILLMILFLNIGIGVLFWYVLSSVNEDAIRQAKLLENCLLRR